MQMPLFLELHYQDRLAEATGRLCQPEIENAPINQRVRWQKKSRDQTIATCRKTWGLGWRRQKIVSVSGILEAGIGERVRFEIPLLGGCCYCHHGGVGLRK